MTAKIDRLCEQCMVIQNNDFLLVYIVELPPVDTEYYDLNGVVGHGETEQKSVMKNVMTK